MSSNKKKSLNMLVAHDLCAVAAQQISGFGAMN